MTRPSGRDFEEGTVGYAAALRDRRRHRGIARGRLQDRKKPLAPGSSDDSGSVTIGYGLIPSARGKGHASEALRRLLLLAWAHGITCVRGDADHDNIASQHVMMAVGMQPAGEDERVKYFEITRIDTTTLTGPHS